MTLLFDGNNFFLRIFFSKAILQERDADPKYALWRFLVFDNILRLVYKFRAKEVIIAIDAPPTWRKHIFKPYKAPRKKAREEDVIDWAKFFEEFNAYLLEIKTHLPYKILKIPFCEADDIIAVLAHLLQPAIIISSDSDYNQLISNTIKLYDPMKKDFVQKIKNFVEISCLNGLKKDNLPNILTPADWDGRSKTPKFGENKAKKIIETGLEEWLQEHKLEDRYKFLKKLIDFDYIPIEVEQLIKKVYSEYNKPPVEKISEFLFKYNWKTYMDKISETETKLLEVY